MEVKERPIIFSDANNVRAIIEGRKVQTRRVMRIQPPTPDFVLATLACTTSREEKRHEGKFHWVRVKEPERLNIIESDKNYFRCPYGVSGDGLWVRERWSDSFRPTETDNGCIYLADYGWKRRPDLMSYQSAQSLDWRNTMFMPRWASRINLEVNGIRIERVQDISCEDVISEGVEVRGIKHWQLAFKGVWNSINEKRGFGWDVNPWVWVVDFELLEVRK